MDGQRASVGSRYYEMKNVYLSPTNRLFQENAGAECLGNCRDV